MNDADVLAFAEALQDHTRVAWAWAPAISYAVTVVDVDDGRLILEFERVQPGTEAVRRAHGRPTAVATVDGMARTPVTDTELATDADRARGLSYPWGVLRYDADGSVALLITHPDGWRLENAEATARAVCRFTFAWAVTLENRLDAPTPPFFYRAGPQVLAE